MSMDIWTSALIIWSASVSLTRNEAMFEVPFCDSTFLCFSVPTCLWQSALPLCSILKSIQHSLQYAWNLLAELGPRVSNVEVHSVLKVDEYFFLFTFIPVIPSVCWALVSIAVRAWLQSCPRLPPPLVIWAIGVGPNLHPYRSGSLYWMDSVRLWVLCFLMAST